MLLGSHKPRQSCQVNQFCLGHPPTRVALSLRGGGYFLTDKSLTNKFCRLSSDITTNTEVMKSTSVISEQFNSKNIGYWGCTWKVLSFLVNSEKLLSDIPPNENLLPVGFGFLRNIQKAESGMYTLPGSAYFQQHGSFGFYLNCFGVSRKFNLGLV